MLEPKKVIGLLLLFLVIIGWLASSSDSDIYQQANNANNKDSASYYVALVWLSKLGKFLNDYGNAITAISTGFVALFTWRLWVSTDKLWAASKEASSIARESAEAAKLQAKAAIAAQIPLVGWVQAKMVEFDSEGRAIFGRDPVNGGAMPKHWRPVFVIHNTGPTRIFTQFYGVKCEVAEELPAEPHFGGMFQASFIIKADDTHPFTPSEMTRLSDEDRTAIDTSKKRLWAYAFVIFRDFMGDAHHIGAIAKWDPKRGFILVERDNYSYYRREKSY